MSLPLFVYGNWASYDEMSDKVPLTEELAMRQLGELLRMRARGVRFDAYLMDAFWFSREGGYREWRKPEWPNGPDRWLAACREHSIMPGLWFTANTLFHMNLPEAWADSIDSSGWGMSLVEGGFLNDYLNVLDHWYSQGLRLFKLDFADFSAVHSFAKRTNNDAELTRQENIDAFRLGLAGFRAAHPDAIFLGYNGFEERECMERTDRPPGRYIDPAWLNVLDSLYCGDPRPSDLACRSFWRSVDIYTDCMTRLFESSGLPLHRVDNCGFMAGKTGTCYWRGKAGWQAMLLLSLARGGSIHVTYGDLSLFTDDDARWWAEAQALYAGAMVEDRTTAFGGWPGKGEIYGWLSRVDDGEVLTVVNPGMERDDIELPEGRDWRVIYADPPGFPDVAEGRLSLAGGQVAVLCSWDRPMLSPVDADLDLDLLPFEPIGLRAGGNRVELGLPPANRGTFVLVVKQTAKNGDVLRTWPGNDERYPFVVRVDGPDGTVDLPRMIDRPVWSGLSWSVYEVPPGSSRATVESIEAVDVILDVDLFLSR